MLIVRRASSHTVQPVGNRHATAIAKRSMTAKWIRTLIQAEFARARMPDGDPDLHSVPPSDR